MSDLFDDLENTLINTANISLKQSLNEMGLDEEERDKIVHSVTSSGPSDLNVDYSKFENHIFFGSAYSSVNFALSRLIRDYPTDGELKDKNEWRQKNTGYENWFFDNYPKQKGYLNVSSGSFVLLNDYENKVSFNSGGLLNSFSVESIIDLGDVLTGTHPIFQRQQSTSNLNSLFILYAENVDSSQEVLKFQIYSASVGFTLTASYSSYVGQPNHVGVTYNRDDNFVRLYINGEEASKKTLGTLTGALYFSPTVEVGRWSFFGVDFCLTGQIDELRVWNKYRSPELIKQNYYRSIHANHSGGLQLYYKFNEPTEYGNKVVDYSGNGLHGTLTGTNSSYAANIQSGTIAPWFKDVGDPILALNNSNVETFVNEQRLSGSNYDDGNQSLIFRLVPESFIDEENTEYQQLFLLLTARHFDRLKLYIDHVSNILKLKTQKYNGPPANLLDLAAKHYGFDIGGIYAGSDPLQYFFGENILSSGSLDSSIETIRTQLKRNILSNLAYILKTKSTQESLKATLRAIGLSDVVTISEYTDFSGGIQTTFSPTTVESKVLNMNQPLGNVYISSSAISDPELYQIRFLMDPMTGSSLFDLDQTIFRVENSSGFDFQIRAVRDNLTSSIGKIKFIDSLFLNQFSSSALPLWDNKWVNLSFLIDPQASRCQYYISSMDRSGILFSESGSADSFQSGLLGGSTKIVFGENLTFNPTKGKLQEFRQWNLSGSTSGTLSASLNIPALERWAYDWELLELDDLNNGYSKLKTHLKLNDFTASSSGTGELRNYANGLSGCYYTGFSSSADFNFPGVYIDKFNINYTYDLNVDNDKIRIREGSNFIDNDANIDIPFISIDFSPITSLNKEIAKWIGDMSRFSNLAADTLSQYREENYELDLVRRQFFENRVNGRINFKAFRTLIRWFDSNFTHLLQQLIPLDIASSLSNYVVEPHILEFNKVKRPIGLASSGQSTTLEAIISTQANITASSNGSNLGLADPGRYGAFVSASGEISEDAYINYSAMSGGGVNYSYFTEKKTLDEISKNNVEHNSPTGYGNGFYTQIITGSNYMKNTLNVVTEFAVSGVYYSGSGDLGTKYLSSSHGQPTTTLTSTFNGVQDARWLWMVTANGVINENSLYYKLNHGIGYGGLWGQLRSRNFSSFFGKPIYPNGSADPSGKTWIGESSVRANPSFNDYVRVFNGDNLKTVMLWPTEKSYNGVELISQPNETTSSFYNGQIGAGFGDVIDIEGYNTLNCEILVRSGEMKIEAPIFSFELKFQFFSKDTPGDRVFETVLSASRTPSSYTQLTVPVTYELSTGELSLNEIINFNLQLERSLPKQKYMRVFVTPKVASSAEGTYYVIMKGTLTKEVKSDNELAIREI